MKLLTYLLATNFTTAIIYLALILLTFITMRLLFSKKTIKENPIESLQKRFSEGKINAQQYEQLKRNIQKEEDLKMKHFFLSRI